MSLPEINLMIKFKRWHQLGITKSGFQHVMILLIQLQGDMELKPNHRLILTTTPITNQTRQHSGQATTIQRYNQA